MSIVSRAEPVATASELRYRALANALPHFVWIYDRDGRLEWVNDRLTEYSGLDVAQINCGAGLALVHPDDLVAVGSEWRRALAEGAVFETEYRLRDRDGRYRWHLGRIVPFRDERGQIVNWFGTATDIHDRRRMEDELRASERRFQTAFQRNPLATTMNRLSDGKCLDVNPAFCELTGYSRRELLARTGSELGVWREADRVRILEAMRRQDSIEQDGILLRPKDGRSRVVSLSCQRIDVDGEPALLTVIRDVTEQRRAEEELRQREAEARAYAEEVEAVLDATPAAVWIADDPECRQVRSSKKGYELLRITAGGQVSKTAAAGAPQHFAVLHDGVELRPEQLPLQRAAREGVELRDFEEEVRFDDGQSVYVFGSAVPLYSPEGKVRGSIAAFVDITRLKLAEAALRESDRRKDEFIAMLSHELRNPLAPIVTAAHLMKLRGDVATPHERGVIERQAAHLMRLVDDLLDVSRIARGKIELNKRPVEISRVVAHAVESVGLLFEQRRQHLSIDVPNSGLVVDADENRLVQVVSNLLTNATRYTPEGGNIDVSARREGERVVLRVRDDGIGIPPELLPNIFELFVQGKRERQGGLGLGLALVRSLLTLHGGSVEAISEGIDRGSELVVRLPLSVHEQLEDGTPGPSPRAESQSSLRILVVDDNVDAAELLSTLLLGAGHEVQVAHDPATALSLVERFEPQLAILDIGLPVMDGYRLGSELRRCLGERAPALVALTGYGQEHDYSRTGDAGFAAHLVKPVEPGRLLQLVEALVTRRDRATPSRQTQSG